VNELELIERLCRELPSNATTVVGAGDDCAVLDLGVVDREFLFKTDAVVEGVHFESGAAPEAIGHKALARCLSDIAAMGGTPMHALVTLGVPAVLDAARLEAVYAGMSRLARRHGVAIVGGETTVAPGGLFLSVAVLGWVRRGSAVLRSGAAAGDALFVTGELGGSLRSGRTLTFEPRLAEGRWLAENFAIHAMMDLSDGLATDLRRLLQASKVGAEIRAASVPLSRAAREGARSGGRSARAAAWTDGEDFELLLAVASSEAVRLRDAWRERFGATRLTCIGKVMAEPTIVLWDEDGRRPMTGNGYIHFQKS